MLKIEADLTIHRVAALAPALFAALQGDAALALDMSRVERVDTAGLQLLLMLRREAQAGGGSLALHAPGPGLRELAHFYGLDALLAEPARG